MGCVAEKTNFDARHIVKQGVKQRAEFKRQACRRVRTVARMLMYKSRQRLQPSENFLTRRRGNLPTSKIAWYKRSQSFRQRARSWPIPQLASDGPRLLETCKRMEEAQHKVERLYARWAELAEKKE